MAVRGCVRRKMNLSTREAEPVIKPNIERRTITEADIDSEDFEVGAYVGVLSIEDFGSDVVYGVRADYHITEDFFAEAAAGDLGSRGHELRNTQWRRAITDRQPA